MNQHKVQDGELSIEIADFFNSREIRSLSIVLGEKLLWLSPSESSIRLKIDDGIASCEIQFRGCTFSARSYEDDPKLAAQDLYRQILEQISAWNKH